MEDLGYSLASVGSLEECLLPLMSGKANEASSVGCGCCLCL